MYRSLFDEFLASSDTLRVYKDGKLIFSSTKDRLLPLLEYIEQFAGRYESVVVFDRIMGNAAALLCIKAGCTTVYSPLGSELAIKTLEKHNIEHHITETVPFIQKDGSEGVCPENICPMEKLSMGKGPEDFYQAMKRPVK